MAPYLQQAVCVGREKQIEKKREKIRRTQTHHEISSSPATAITSRKLATKQLIRFSPYSPASIDSRLWRLAPCRSRNQYKRRMLPKGKNQPPYYIGGFWAHDNSLGNAIRDARHCVIHKLYSRRTISSRVYSIESRVDFGLSWLDFF